MPRKNAKRKSSPTETATAPVHKASKQEEAASKEISKHCDKQSGTSKNEKSKYFSDQRKERLPFDFYDAPCLDLAKKLLGQTLVRKLDDGTIVSGTILETESYLGSDDSSAHSFSGQTKRNGAMFMDPGTAYVYNIYGSLCCMNISSQGSGHAVLLRALEPQEGTDRMTLHRQASQKSAKPKPLKLTDLCSGPSKFCQALAITKNTCNELNMVTSDKIWLEKGSDIEEGDVVVSTRIGIEGAGEEAASKPYRFYVRGNKHVSKRDKKAEGL